MPSGLYEQVDFGEDGTTVIEAGKHYRIKWTFSTGGANPCPSCPASVAGYISCTLILFHRITPLNKCLLGGGVRIAKIGYFTDDVDPLYYAASHNLDYYDGEAHMDGYAPPVREINYNYQFFNDSYRSSGALVFAKPIFKYARKPQKALQICTDDAGFPHYYTYLFDYSSETDFNNLNAIRTRGVDVGYKNVQVTQTGNGYSRYVYRTPIDVPEDGDYKFTWPFTPTSNKDCERGLLLQEWQYNELGKPLSFVDNTYGTIRRGKLVTGMDIWSEAKCAQVAEASGNYATYASKYKSWCIDGTGGSGVNNILFCQYCDPINEYITHLIHEESYAWPQLTQKITSKYSYEGSVQSELTTKELFTYNSTNLQVATHETFNSGTSESIKTEFTYHTGPKNRISDYESIVEMQNEKDKRATFYQYSIANQTTIPLDYYYSQYTVKGENRNSPNSIFVFQIKKADAYENILSFSLSGYHPNGSDYQEYIYGYNNTLPIISMEIDPLNSESPTPIIPATYLSNAITLSNSTTATDQELIDALALIRSSLPNRNVTTYTYKPLVGITSVTDPNGNTIRYNYDEFNRLISVTDSNGKLISENKYKYKFQ